MLVFWKERLVVLATPKTGTTAIETALQPLAALPVLRPGALKHTDAARWQRYIRPFLNEAAGAPFEAVALMRDPIDWLGSWYRFRQRDDILDMPRATQGLSFAQFVEDYLSDPAPLHAAVGSQAAFLRGAEGEACGVDRLFRYEEIGNFVAYLEDALGFAIELPVINVSPEGDLALPETLEKRLRAALTQDYALYDAIR
ncbi:MAG: hypothetical protein Kow0013_05330 [Pararhodobacter sp.]